MHEQSETEERDGKYLNVYGRSLPQAGQPLPGEQPFDNLQEAVLAAKLRSQMGHRQPSEQALAVNRVAAAMLRRAAEAGHTIQHGKDAVNENLLRVMQFFSNSGGQVAPPLPNPFENR